MLIATRILKVRRPSTADIDVPIRIFAPEEDPVRGWGCRFEIEWPAGVKTMTARGIDAVQALEIGLTLVGTHLYASSYHKDGELMFDRPGSGYGFPVPQNLRDMLIGDDAKYL